MSWKRLIQVLVVVLTLAPVLANPKAWDREAKPKDPHRGPQGSDPRITLFVRDGSLHAVLGEVSSQAGARLKVVGLKDRPVTVAASGASLQGLMDSVCEGVDCRWKLETYLVVWPARERTPEWSLVQDDPLSKR